MKDLKENSKNSEYKYKTVILSDLPTTSDDFGSHERIANAIVSLIKNEKGNKAIALTGGWGSGKSTVVEILKSKYHEDNYPD